MKLFRLFLLKITSVLFGIMFYHYITWTWDFQDYLLQIPLLILLVATLLMPVNIPKIHMPFLVKSIFVLLASIAFSCSIAFLYDKLHNLSPVVLSGATYDDETVCIDFRQNGTFKVRYSNMLKSSVSYGKYSAIGDFVIQVDNLEFGVRKVRDTLRIVGDEIHYEYDDFMVNNKNGIMYITQPKARCVF